MAESSISLIPLDEAVAADSRLILYSAGYRSADSDRRLDPADFYGGLPPEAITIDIRSHPYSPFAPDFTGSGVAAAVDRWKPGRMEFYHLRALGNTHRDASGKRRTPPIYVDPERGFEQLETLIRRFEAAVIFCACSYATMEDPVYRCHRFFVADEIAERIPRIAITHLRL